MWLVSQTAGASDVNNQHLLDNHQNPVFADRPHLTQGHPGGRIKNLAKSTFCRLAIWPVIHLILEERITGWIALVNKATF